MGGPAGSLSEQEDLPEVMEPPHAPPESLRAVYTPGSNLLKELPTWGRAPTGTPLTQTCLTSRPQSRPWASKNSRFPALCTARLLPASRLSPALLPAQSQPYILLTPLVMPASRPLSSELRDPKRQSCGLAPRPSYSMEVTICSSRHFPGGNQMPLLFLTHLSAE